jgi:hypothetical protein
MDGRVYRKTKDFKNNSFLIDAQLRQKKRQNKSSILEKQLVNRFSSVWSIFVEQTMVVVFKFGGKYLQLGAWAQCYITFDVRNL